MSTPMDQRDGELKPCPLCDGRAEVADKRPKRRTYVICRSCGLRTKIFICASASISIWNTRTPIPPTEGDIGPSDLIRIELRQAMLDCWNTICADTDCHPLDIKRQGRKLYFSPDHWADMIAAELASRLSSHASLRDLVSSGGLPEANSPTEGETNP